MGVATETRPWTLDDLERLSTDDGNVYELIHGELFVTPAPSPRHETVAARLRRPLDVYVEVQGLGLVYTPRSVIQLKDSQVEPDLAVRTPPPGTDWRKGPLPILVVEILSPSTDRLDHVRKRALYMELGIPDYWIVDPDSRNVTVARPGKPDEVFSDRLEWHPDGASQPLIIDLAEIFDGAD